MGAQKESFLDANVNLIIIFLCKEGGVLDMALDTSSS